MSNSKQYEPNSSMADPYASMVRPDMNVRFLPVGRAALDYKNPKDWCDYPALDKATVDALSLYLTPKCYMELHYDKGHAFKEFLHDGLHLLYQKFEYFSIKPGTRTLQTIDKVGEKVFCEVLHLAAQTKIKTYLVAMGQNILKGDFGRIDNLSGPRFVMLSRIDAGQETLKGFIPYFQLSLTDENDEIFQIYMFLTKTKQFTLIYCKADDHDYVLSHMEQVCSLKYFDKICTWCGKTRGGGKDMKLLKCKCKCCRYCSKECQALHWPKHKLVCPIKAARVGAAATKDALQVVPRQEWEFGSDEFERDEFEREEPEWSELDTLAAARDELEADLEALWCSVQASKALLDAALAS